LRADPDGVASLPARGAWIETPPALVFETPPASSLPARGAWIETERDMRLGANGGVAPREGGVD